MLYRPSTRHGAKDMFLRFGCASLALALATQFAASGAEAQYRDDRRDYRYDRNDDRRERRKERKSEQRPVEQAQALKADGPLLMLVSLNERMCRALRSPRTEAPTTFGSSHTTPKSSSW